ncbi:MAG: hypothetical protein K0R07_1186 [Sedimentibacter sp.]|jgi:hypothetical protein|nr:hypothetical protein [Sedimentibacter sp.]
MEEYVAKEYAYEILGQPSMLGNKERKLKFYFSEPSNGINAETGLLLIIAGFGGNANSNVYIKMRNTFADKYNLITIQCDYFGYEFMQAPNNIILKHTKEDIKRYFSNKEVEYIYKDNNIFLRLMEISSKYKINILAKENLNENINNYCDMGIIQAIDNITAIIAVMEVIKNQGYKINEDKVILYGHSHGAYLSYLCNAFAPNLFSLLIDNSSWLFPAYLKGNRYVNKIYGDSILSVEFEYFAKTVHYDEEILNLPSIYSKFNNNCDIICYHGTNDNLISNKDKVVLKNIINNFTYNEIDETKVDNKIFKSNHHGLGTDFLELFDLVINEYHFKNRVIKRSDIIFYETQNNIYEIDYSNITPILNVEEK